MNQRSIIEISGADRVSFLQGIVTQDVTKLADEKILFAAVLSPQGKILHDMFLVHQPEAILIDTPSMYAETLIKRLTMYKLRAKITIRDVSSEWSLSLGDGLPDPRHVELPKRLYASLRAPRSNPFDQKMDCHGAEAPRNDDPPIPNPQSLSLGIPDSGTDFAPDELVAMDAGYDVLNAISFTKGCYVGQEVTARMHYKNIARKGFFIVESPQHLSTDAALLMGNETIPLRRTEGNLGLVFLKFDDAFSAAPKSVNNLAVNIRAPQWMGAKIAQYIAAQNKQ
jgi:folate-binding protein YgfZ